MRQLIAATLFSLVCIPAHAGTIFVDSGSAGIDYTLEVESYRERIFSRIIPQSQDFSCGSAALATMLHYYYDWPTTESEVLEAMYISGDRERIRKEGFSLLDMKQYLASIGMESDGYQLPLEKLTSARIPAIVLLNINGYLHFVVIQGVRDDSVLVGDPALGRKIIPRDEFNSMWNGIMFVVRGNYDIARQHYDKPEHWEVTEKAVANLGTRAAAQDIYEITRDMNPLTTYYYR